MQGYQGEFIVSSTTIPISTTETAAIPLNGFNLVGIYFPAAFTGTAITFEACDTLAGTYLVVKSTTSGSSLSYTVAQGTYAAIDPKDFYGINFLKIKSGSTEIAARTLVISLKGF